MQTNCSCTQPERVCEKCSYHCDDRRVVWFHSSVLEEWDLLIDDCVIMLKKKVR